MGLYTQSHVSLYARVFDEAEAAKPSLWSRVFSRKKKPTGPTPEEKAKRAEQIVQGFEKEIAQERPKPVTRFARSTVKHHPPFRERNRDKFLRNIRQQAVKTNINLRQADHGDHKWEPFKQTHSPGAISIAKEIERSMPKTDSRADAQGEVTRTMRAARDALQKRAWAEAAKRRREEEARAKAERRRQGLERRQRAAAV